MASVKSFTEYRLPKDAYVSFDAVSLKQLMTDLLNQNEVFRDQNFEGSNLNSLMDMVAVSYHVLLFYLNSTSSESTFTAATLRENVIKITSLLNYKPIGPQTSVVNIGLSANSTLPANIYTLKRFASLNANGYAYTTLNDISFEKTTADNEALAINDSLVYQGIIKEYPQFTAVGEEFEVVYLVDSNNTTTGTEKFVADNTFTVYVYDIATGLWSEWSETASLFESNSSDKVYEKKINENGNYEFKFGSGINGRKLNAGDKVQIYYIYSDGEKGKVSQGAFSSSVFSVFNSPTFNTISAQVYTDEENFITPAQLKAVSVSNISNSSNITALEDADSIKNNATKLFSTQNRLVTLQDYENFISKNYSNVVESVKCINNDTFTSKYLKYFYDIGLKTPLDDGRVLLNQVDFASSTNFNNIYVFSTPKIQPIIDNKVPNYVSQSVKQLIINTTRPITMTTHNVVCVDPVYKAFSFGLQVPGEEEAVTLTENTRLIVVRDNSSRINSAQIKNRIVSIITEYFSNLKLNDVVDLFVVNANILNIEGVKNTLTRRIDVGYEAQKLNFAVWNPLYPLNDVLFTSQNYQLQEYEYAFLYDTTNLSQQIIVEDE